eukprot:275361_1
MAIKNNKTEYVKEIINSCGFNLMYLKKVGNDFSTLWYVIGSKSMRMIGVYFKYVEKFLKDNKDSEQGMEDILNNVVSFAPTALFCACWHKTGISIFEQLYNKYGSESKKNALSATNYQNKTVLDMCREDEYRDEDIENFILDANPTLTKYVKMKKLGMPMLSIVNKMRKDRICADLITEFNGEKKDEDENGRPKFDKYKKMKKLNIPMAGIINKMKMDGCEQDLIDEFNGKGKKSSNVEDNPALAKYVKMEKIGVPMAAIIHKMQKDRISADLIDEFSDKGK